VHRLRHGRDKAAALIPKEDPIGDLLPFKGVRGAFILRGDMYTKSEEWMLLEDSKKNAK